MDLTQYVGTVTNPLPKPITANNADITSAQPAKNVVATYPKIKRKSLTTPLKPLLLSLLKQQKTEWGYTAMSTKEICRSLNGAKQRDFCHFAFRHDNKTKGSWSQLRGCRNLKREEIRQHCQIWYKDVQRALLELVKSGEIRTYKGRALDLKNMGNHKVVSSDLYRFWIMNS
jgi:hypothetical protein